MYVLYKHVYHVYSVQYIYIYTAIYMCKIHLERRDMGNLGCPPGLCGKFAPLPDFVTCSRESRVHLQETREQDSRVARTIELTPPHAGWCIEAVANLAKGHDKEQHDQKPECFACARKGVSVKF